ncbi:MAG: DnaJ domain-containing protein [Vulcanimicrobiota bacterium]
MPDYYEILQVAPDAEPEVISFAYKALAKKYHPDHRGPDGQEKMALINEAYEVLRDPARREAYDQGRSTAQAPAPAAPVLAGPAPAAPRRRPIGLAWLALPALLLAYFLTTRGVATIYLHRADARFESGDYRAAIAAYTVSLSQQARQPQVYFRRGRSFYELGLNGEAVVDFTNAIEAGADRDEVLWWRGQAYARDGDLERARADLESSNDPRAPATLEALKEEPADGPGN